MWPADLAPAERRALLLVAAVYLVGGAWDLWKAHFPPRTLEPGVAAMAPRPDPDGAAPWRRSSSPAGRQTPIGINQASESELDELPGIGPVLAGRIVRFRSDHGPFRSVAELAAVPGVGPRLLERLTPLVTTDSLPTAHSTP